MSVCARVYVCARVRVHVYKCVVCALSKNESMIRFHFYNEFQLAGYVFLLSAEWLQRAMAERYLEDLIEAMRRAGNEGLPALDGG